MMQRIALTDAVHEGSMQRRERDGNRIPRYVLCSLARLAHLFLQALDLCLDRARTRIRHLLHFGKPLFQCHRLVSDGIDTLQATFIALILAVKPLEHSKEQAQGVLSVFKLGRRYVGERVAKLVVPGTTDVEVLSHRARQEVEAVDFSVFATVTRTQNTV